MGTTYRRGRSRAAGVAIIMSLLIAACGGAEESADSPVTRQYLVDQLVEGTGVSQPVATCIVDKALDTYGLEGLADAIDSDDPAVTGDIVDVSTACILSDGEASEPTAVPAVATPAPTTPPPPVPTQPPIPTDTPEPEAAPKPTPTSVAEPQTITSPEFCDASRSAYVSHLVVDNLASTVSAPALQTGLGQILLDIAEAMNAAPTAELAEAPRTALISLSNVYEAAGDFDYDADAFFAAIGQDLRADFETYLGVVDLLELYLAGPCGVSLDGARAEAVTGAAALETQYPAAPSTPEADEGEPATGTYMIEKNFANIELEAPASWDMVESWNDGSTRGVIVAPDIEAYDSSWNANGVRITAADLNSTAVSLDDLVRSTAARNECKLDTTDNYNDGLYQGQINRYVNCGGGPAQAVVIAALNDDNTILVLVELQMLELDESVVQLIISSFIA